MKAIHRSAWLILAAGSAWAAGRGRQPVHDIGGPSRVTVITESAENEDAPLPGTTQIRLIRRAVSDVVLSPDGKRLAVGLTDSGGGGLGASRAEFVAVLLFDIESQRVVGKVLLDGSPTDLAWLPDGTLWALESLNTKVRRLDLEKFAVAETISLRADPTRVGINLNARLSVSPDKTHLVISGFDGVLAVYEAAGWKRLRTLDDAGKPLPVEGTWSRDGKSWMTSSGDPSEVVSWDIETGVKKNLGAGAAPVEGPDKRVWALTRDRTAFGPVAPKQDEKRDWYRARDSKIVLARFSPDGRFVALGLEDGVVTVVDAATGALFARFRHDILEKTNPRVSCLCWAPDSSWIAAGRMDGSSELLRPEVPDPK